MAHRKPLYRIVGEHATGAKAPLARSRDLGTLARRVRSEGGVWRELGWKAFWLEDDSMGYWTDVLVEALRTMFHTHEISRETWNELRHLAYV